MMHAKLPVPLVPVLRVEHAGGWASRYVLVVGVMHEDGWI